ncbi:cisplatin damage response ATP-dependent DNA ligase [Rubrimonas sp.]|uniref:cisplatin damage response ATP-dependent DNA ligase n=1 Tax=Rubrimonas sp. TaxID=2036015 RepID=UPI002FDED94E
MTPFAQLLEELVTTSGRVAKLSLLAAHFRETPDPDRGYALAALSDGLRVPQATPAVFRALIESRVDPVLFRLSYDFVGDLAETVALLWPGPAADGAAPRLGAVVEQLRQAKPAARAQVLAELLDAMGPSERFALVKLCAGGPRVGVSARLARVALAQMSDRPVERIEEFWHGVAPPYAPLWRWLEGGPEPEVDAALAFRPMMLAQPVEAFLHSAAEQRDGPPDPAETLRRLADRLAPADFAAEWKWDGVRVQACAGPSGRALYSRTGEDLGPAFPELIAAMDWSGCVDGELLVGAEGAVAPFSELQKRLNRKRVTARDLAERPAFIRAYDLLHDGAADLRGLPFAERRARLEAWHAEQRPTRLDLSPQVAFEDWPALAGLRDGARDAAQEGLMLKRRAGAYLAGRPMGEWFKWKRDPLTADCVLVYAQRGHGKRSSYYSDFTFAAWTDGPEGPALAPVGKAYSGFTDEELLRLDRFVRENTVERYGPVRAVRPALVLEIAFDAVQRSTRHRSGVAMRFPRIRRIRWDKPAAEADRVEALLRLAPG